MLRYILNRLLAIIPVLVGVSIITFILIELAPGDPAEIILSKRDIEITAQVLSETRSQMGLDGPIYMRYFHWLTRIVQGDLGISYTTGEPVAKEIFSRIPATIELAAGGLVAMIVIALPVGTVSALFRRTVVDHVGRLLALLGASLPSFYLGLLLISLLSLNFEWIPVMGKGTINHLLLPSLTLGFGLAATYARLLRAGLLEVLEQDYIRAARARGLKETVIIGHHAFKNALIPLITVFGLTVGNLLGGTMVVEHVFAWPGVGRLAIQAIFNRDIPVLQGYAVMMAVIYVLVNLVVDISYRYLDPRIRLNQKEGG